MENKSHVWNHQTEKCSGRIPLEDTSLASVVPEVLAPSVRAEVQQMQAQIVDIQRNYSPGWKKNRRGQSKDWMVDFKVTGMLPFRALKKPGISGSKFITKICELICCWLRPSFSLFFSPSLVALGSLSLPTLFNHPRTLTSVHLSDIHLCFTRCLPICTASKPHVLYLCLTSIHSC